MDLHNHLPKKTNPQLYLRAVTTCSGDMSGLQLTSYIKTLKMEVPVRMTIGEGKIPADIGYCVALNTFTSTLYRDVSQRNQIGVMT